MASSSTNDKLKIIDEIIKDYPDLYNPLELYKMILQAQKQIRDDPKKGTIIDWSDESIIEDLQKKVRQFNQPITNFLNPNIFNSKALINTCERIVKAFIEKGLEKKLLDNFLNELFYGKISIHDLVAATLKGDAGYFKDFGERFKVDPALILFIASTLIQPCLEEIAKRIDSSLLEKWWQAPCPICGRRPIVARLKARKRYLICSLCEAEYLTDLFFCVNCGNIDPTTLKFLAPEDYPEFRVDFCEKCKHYLKVIDESKLKKPIPKGFEDIITIDLDIMANELGLKRV
ncbi:MAG: formate dehydrogenase accessory protein FdhE [Nitrososphaerales archaeon]